MDDIDILNQQQEILEMLQSKKVAMKADSPKRSTEGPVFCEDCDIEIPTKRLELAPYTIRCVDCQDLFEKKAI